MSIIEGKDLSIKNALKVIITDGMSFSFQAEVFTNLNDHLQVSSYLQSFIGKEKLRHFIWYIVFFTLGIFREKS